MIAIKIERILTTDLLIVGGGIAGLSCAVEAHKQGIEHILISKMPLGSGASFFPLKATLGIQVTGDESDHKLFCEDIERVAQGMNNPKIVNAYVEESASAVGLLNEIGFQAWRRNDNRPACFARYPRPIYLIKDWKSSAQRAKRIISAQQTGQVFENATLLYIVSEHNQVKGAVFSLKQEASVEYVFCQTRHIILATGGVAGLYKDNLYPADIISSAHFIAMQAGASLTNLEYIQFIPSFIEPKYKVLFGEHTLKYCTAVTDKQGRALFSDLTPQQFAQMMNERSGYAPFSIDFPCVRFDLDIMEYLLKHPDEQGVYLHYSPQLYQNKEEFYQVYLDWLKQEAGIDLRHDTVAIAPFAHSCNGGIEIDEYAQSRVEGLFAVGEISACIEGANRLGGNSVGGSLVFAKRAVGKIAQSLTPHSSSSVFNDIARAEKALNALYNVEGDPTLQASDVLSEIRRLMTKFANVYRTEYHLTQLLQELETLERRFEPLTHAPFQGIEVFYALKSAQALVQSMRMRTESRGSHYRADFPLRSEQPYRLSVVWKAESIQVEKIKVRDIKKQP